MQRKSRDHHRISRHRKNDGSSACRPRIITPNGYVEGPCMLKRNGVYHFIWSEGGWTNGTYRACASHSTDSLNISPDGKVILDSSDIANGPEHISYINISGTDEWRMVYHRRIIGDLECGHRMLCIDDLRFDGDEILPVQMT